MKPKLRFNGFEGEWEDSVIGNIATFSKGRGYSKADLCNSGTPIILYGRLYTNYTTTINEVDTFASPKDNSVYSKGGEVIIPASGETPEDIAIASSITPKGIILGGDLNVLTFNQKKHSPSFMALAISNSKTHKELSGYAQGKSIVHLHNDSIAKGHIAFASISEQESIASFFTTLDAQISASTSRHASLKQIKAASLQAMFPQEGETVPKLRFKGFEGEWVKCKVKDICKKVSSKLSENSLGPNSGEYAVFGASGFIQNIPSYDMSVPYVGIIKDGSGVGRCKLYPAYSSILGTMQYILPLENFDISYIAYLFETLNLLSFVSGSGIPHIYFKDYCDISIYIPQDIAEQEKIASYFTNLDRQIELQAQRLEKLKQIKSACLDNMFV